MVLSSARFRGVNIQVESAVLRIVHRYRLAQKYLMKNVTYFNIDKREKYFATIIQSNILGPALTRQTGWRCLIQLSEKSLIKTRGSEIIWAGGLYNLVLVLGWRWREQGSASRSVSPGNQFSSRQPSSHRTMPGIEGENFSSVRAGDLNK